MSISAQCDSQKASNKEFLSFVRQSIPDLNSSGTIVKLLSYLIGPSKSINRHKMFSQR